MTRELFGNEDQYGRDIRVKGFHYEDGKWFEINAAHNELTVRECSGGQEVFLVIGERLQQKAIAERVIPSAIIDQVWHNGQVYKVDDQ